MSAVDKLLSEPQRNWEKRTGASREEIERLTEGIKIEMPAEILELLRFSNGGFGDLACPPRLLSLYSCDEIIAAYQDEGLQEDFFGFLFIGSNAGLESIALDCRGTKPYPVVMIDRIAGPGSATLISPDCKAFVAAIGLPYNKTS